MQNLYGLMDKKLQDLFIFFKLSIGLLTVESILSIICHSPSQLKKDFIMGILTQNKIRKVVENKNIVITGGSSGIGKRTALLLSKCGAHVILIARTLKNLEKVKQEIELNDGKASIYPCDLTNIEEIGKISTQILTDFGYVDILINNAGRSIRRAVEESFDRFHDFERTMDINYFGAVKITMAFLDSMLARKSGHIINISSIGVLANSPRFSAYVASKSALDSFSRCMAAEVRSRNVHVTSVFMPLVRTPMIAPTKLYNYMPTLSSYEAALMVAEAIVHKPHSIASNMGKFAAASYALVPSINVKIQSTSFRIFPSSKAAQSHNKELNVVQKVFSKVFSGELH